MSFSSQRASPAFRARRPTLSSLPRREPPRRKIDERKPIDAVPAMALAVWRATQAETSDIPLAAFV